MAVGGALESKDVPSPTSLLISVCGRRPKSDSAGLPLALPPNACKK